ncbi:MAG: tripartite tricarboxylate transporter substrate binding protein [Emcibacteraceae bacterium]|nr:tripartite tricarboxylate transporter substrate binding protein [Emcibacteraceae bacterium]
MNITRNTVILILGLLLGACGEKDVSVSSDDVEKFPAKELTVIVPYSPGGGVDTTVRMLASVAPNYLNDNKIVVRNMPGGGGVIGQTAGAQADADGYNLLAFSSSVTSNPFTKNASYSHLSFGLIGMYGYDPEVLIVPAGSPHNSIEDFLEAGKVKKITISTSGHSTSHHIASLVLSEKTGVDFTYLHNKGAAEQIQQILGDHVDATMMGISEASEYIKNGSLKSLGIMTAERDASFPDLPTFIEQDIDIEWGAFRGLAVPASTPAGIQQKLAEAFRGIIQDPENAERMAIAGYPISYRSPEEFREYVGSVVENLEQILPSLKAQ